jgi:hypothetical protein
MLRRNRTLASLAATGYLLAVCFSALFHNHHGCRGHNDCEHSESPWTPGMSALDADDSQECPVCQFLAQKPAPIDVVASASSAPLTVAVVLPALPAARDIHFAAWQSRAPPAFV